MCYVNCPWVRNLELENILKALKYDIHPSYLRLCCQLATIGMQVYISLWLIGYLSLLPFPPRKWRKRSTRKWSTKHKAICSAFLLRTRPTSDDWLKWFILTHSMWFIPSHQGPAYFRRDIHIFFFWRDNGEEGGLGPFLTPWPSYTLTATAFSTTITGILTVIMTNSQRAWRQYFIFNFFLF